MINKLNLKFNQSSTDVTKFYIRPIYISKFGEIPVLTMVLYSSIQVSGRPATSVYTLIFNNHVVLLCTDRNHS